MVNSLATPIVLYLIEVFDNEWTGFNSYYAKVQQQQPNTNLI